MTSQAKRVLDEQGFPLIPHDELCFIDTNVPFRSGVTWSPPTNYWDALRYGRDVALDLLRVAPRGSRAREDDVSCIAGIHLLEMQFAAGRPHDGSGASAAIYAFWQAMLHFIFTAPTHQNVEAYRTKTSLSRMMDEIIDLRAQVASHRRRSGGRRTAHP